MKQPFGPPQSLQGVQRCNCGEPGHFVQFYENDGFLISSVCRFLSEGLADGGTALVIATPEHIDAIVTQLKSGGFPIESLKESGVFVALDAAQTLESITVDGLPNAERFTQQIGSRITTFRRGPRKLYAFGEMVALLCGMGKTEEALQLEELWNSECRKQEISLLCAYPLNSFSSVAESSRFVRVCNAHSRVIPSESYRTAEHLVEDDQQARAIALLQQKAVALEAEIAARKMTEETLRRREAELTAFLETSSLGLHWVDRNGVIIWVNQAELDLLGYAKNEYVGRHIGEFHADAPVIKDILEKLNNAEKLVNYEARLRCKDGSIKIVLIDSSVRWEDKNFLHTQCFTRDVTADRRAQVLSQHLAAIVQSSDDAILSKNLDGIITSWNEGARRIFGYNAEEVIGHPVTILIPPERLAEEPSILARLRKGERIDHFETIRKRKDGSLVDISLTVSPIHNEKGKVVGASKIARDISDKRQIEQALEITRKALASSNGELEQRVQERTAALSNAVAQLEEFSYTVSHDVRAPLRAIQGYSQALHEDYGDSLDPRALHYVNRISENALRLEKMVNDVLTFSRVSRSELHLENIQLDKLVREVVQQDPLMQCPHATVDVATLQDVWAHEPSVIQIVSNLLSNAVKFVPKGVAPVVTVWTEATESSIILSVRDNGIGIPPPDQARLFRMFERLHPELAHEGTGIGLAIVRKAANRIGGEVGVQSDGMNGSTFWVRFPCAAFHRRSDNDQNPTPAASDSTASSNKHHVASFE